MIAAGLAATTIVFRPGTARTQTDPRATGELDDPDRVTLPLDVPVTLESSADRNRSFALVDRPEGIYLYRPTSGRVLARLPRFEVGSALANGGGTPLERVSSTPKPPALLQPIAGWPQRLSAAPAGAPIVLDFEGDARMEVVVALEDGTLLAYAPDGSVLEGWPRLLEAAIGDGPTARDLNDDGLPELLVSTTAGVAHALRGREATELPGWPLCLQSEHTSEAIFASPAVGRGAKTGEAVIALAGARGTIQLFNAAGRPMRGWPASAMPDRVGRNAPGLFATPVFGDVNGDGRDELVVASNAGLVELRLPDGRGLRGWPQRLNGARRAGFGRLGLADVDGDGNRDVVVATDRGFPGPARLYAFSATGNALPGWTIDLPEPVNGGVAFADLDNTPGVEVAIAGIGGHGQIGIYGAGGRPLPGWPVTADKTSFDQGVVLADIDGDERPELLALGTRAEYEGGARLVAYTLEGKSLAGFPWELPGTDAYAGGLTVADLDLDGRNEILLSVGGRAQVLGLETNGIASRRGAPWPRSGHGLDGEDLPHPRAGTPSSAAPRKQDPVGPPAPLVPGVERLELPRDLASSLDPKRTLSFVLHRPAAAHLEVVDVRGDKVRTLLDGKLPAGFYALAWDGTNETGAAEPSGVYFFQLDVDGKQATRQLLVLLR